MKKPIELTEVVLARKGVGTIARGPIMYAKDKRAYGVLIGPVEALKGDLVGIIAKGRQTQIWTLEEGFLLVGRKIRGGTWANGAKFDFKLDISDMWSTAISEKMYSDRKIEYLHAFNDPDVVVIL